MIPKELTLFQVLREVGKEYEMHFRYKISSLPIERARLIYLK